MDLETFSAIPAMSMTQPPLLGLFEELIAHHVPLGIRDYVDGLRALQFGFGGWDRTALQSLARALWARTDEERRLITRYFEAIPPPPAQLISELDRQIAGIEGNVASTSAAALRADQPNRLRSEPPAAPGPLGTKLQPTSAGSEASVRVSFAASREGNGLLLPRVTAQPLIEEEYALHPQTLVSPRDLTVLWRRFRRTTRRGHRTELDMQATIRERCRKGTLNQMVCRPRRANSARLLILADVSPSMEPWRPFLVTLENSLKLGRLALAGVRYFTNLPRRWIYNSSNLTSPAPLDDELRRFEGAGLMVISDGGSARGFLNRRRAAQTSDFLAAAAGIFRSIVWLNPMPRERWAGTSAGLIANHPFAVPLPLDTTQLQVAIDILRGAK